MKRVEVATTHEVVPQVVMLPKEVNPDLPPHSREINDQTVPPVVQVVDLVVQTEDLETIMALAVADSEIVPLVVVRAKVNEAAESIDILKDR